MRVDFLDFTRNFKEFLAVHSFLCFLILVYSMWLFLSFRSLSVPLACRFFFDEKIAARLLLAPFWHYLVILSRRRKIH